MPFFFLFFYLLPTLSFAAPVVLTADQRYQGNYINYFVFSPSTESPSQNALIPLGQLGPNNLNSSGTDPLPVFKKSGIIVSTAKVQVTMVQANSTKPVQTFCSISYYDFAFPTTVRFDSTNSFFIPGACAAEITSVMATSIY